MANIYRQKVMSHYTSPHHRGLLSKPDKVMGGQHISCGDEVTFHLKLDKQKRVSKVGWEGSGCTISQAAASLLADMMMGKTLAQIKKLDSQDFLREMEVDLSPARQKCALLPLYTVKEEPLES